MDNETLMELSKLEIKLDNTVKLVQSQSVTLKTELYKNGLESNVKLSELEARIYSLEKHLINVGNRLDEHKELLVLILDRLSK